MTQTTLLALARIRIPEIASTDVISDANLLIILNLACTEFINKTDALPTSGTFNLVLDTTEYALSTYVTAFGKIRKEGLWIYNAVSTKWRQLDPTTTAKLTLDYPDWLNTSSGCPLQYSIEGDTLTLHPKASSTYTGTDYLKLFYFQRSTDMAGGSYYPFSGSATQYTFLADYEETLIDYVRYEVKQMLKKNADAEEARTTFYNKCAYIKQQLLYRPDLITQMSPDNAGGIRSARSMFGGG